MLCQLLAGKYVTLSNELTLIQMLVSEWLLFKDQTNLKLREKLIKNVQFWRLCLYDKSTSLQVISTFATRKNDLFFLLFCWLGFIWQLKSGNPWHFTTAGGYTYTETEVIIVVREVRTKSGCHFSFLCVLQFLFTVVILGAYCDICLYILHNLYMFALMLVVCYQYKNFVNM